ncbi:MAG: NUDIX domain-containing protein [Planctomycetota bacterium]|nr:MAG: NUDIX domain-containing protein [Planctomycetota bacterium]REJ92014.1 MAG: NUDIX domain-containing protein [Planctomycetota bacterium]REK28550.1 MAG: NUDIX domain-containing protein [Planctomycetota bacterium]REK39165.1 MAG: NUDIX domain-containing protein [Planctomycetota bacterium]
MTTEMQEYVLCFAHPLPHRHWDEVLLIEKKRPQWQAGKYNLPGGHIETGETPHEAAIRELDEETSIRAIPDKVQLRGTIEGPGFVVYVMFCPFDGRWGRNQTITRTDERVFWLPTDEAFLSPHLLPNLRLIIPLVQSPLEAFSITKHGDSEYEWTTDVFYCTRPKDAHTESAQA